MTEHVKTEIAEGIMTLTLARRQKNALSNRHVQAMSEWAGAREKDRRSAWFYSRATATVLPPETTWLISAPSQWQRHRRAGRRIASSANLSKATRPLIAAVQGNAVGVGTTMLLHCDLVFLADTAKLITPFVNLALVPEAASSWLLPARIGHVRAYAMLGRAARRSHRLGLRFGQRRRCRP